eukprot:jgi/Botrbrau1/22554/Bobra.0413s0001.1
MEFLKTVRPLVFLFWWVFFFFFFFFFAHSLAKPRPKMALTLRHNVGVRFQNCSEPQNIFLSWLEFYLNFAF